MLCVLNYDLSLNSEKVWVMNKQDVGFNSNITGSKVNLHS